MWLFNYCNTCIDNAQKHAKAILILIQKYHVIRATDTCIKIS